MIFGWTDLKFGHSDFDFAVTKIGVSAAWAAEALMMMMEKQKP